MSGLAKVIRSLAPPADLSADLRPYQARWLRETARLRGRAGFAVADEVSTWPAFSPALAGAGSADWTLACEMTWARLSAAVDQRITIPHESVPAVLSAEVCRSRGWAPGLGQIIALHGALAFDLKTMAMVRASVEHESGLARSMCIMDPLAWTLPLTLATLEGRP